VPGIIGGFEMPQAATHGQPGHPSQHCPHRSSLSRATTLAAPSRQAARS
jgi:hypothetical protein